MIQTTRCSRAGHMTAVVSTSTFPSTLSTAGRAAKMPTAGNMEKIETRFIYEKLYLQRDLIAKCPRTELRLKLIALRSKETSSCNQRQFSIHETMSPSTRTLTLHFHYHISLPASCNSFYSDPSILRIAMPDGQATNQS